MTRIVIILACFITAPALAHIGHVGGLASYEYWVIAVALAAAAVFKGRGAEASEENEPELQEA